MKFKTFSLSLIILLISQSNIKAQSLSWFEYSEADFKYKSQNQPVVILFWASWCGYCRKLDKETLANSEVYEKLQKFALYKVDSSQRESLSVQELLKKFNVTGFPTILIFRPGQNEVRISGFVTADELKSML